MSKDFTPSAKEADPFEDAQYAVATEETRRTSFWGKIWDTADLPKPERKLLFKVDAIILTFASLGYFIKNLDQTNVNNAVSDTVPALPRERFAEIGFCSL